MYDYLIVGAGMYGAVFARQMTDHGKSCLVIDRRNHIAGNIWTHETEGITVHHYGPHIFHTDNESVWAYVNRFATFNHFIYCPIANYKGELYNLPFNMNTFTKDRACSSKLAGVCIPAASTCFRIFSAACSGVLISGHILVKVFILKGRL